MRLPSVATESSSERRARIAVLTVDERIARSLALGQRDLDLYVTASGLDRATARLAVERRRQARRRPSASLRMLLR